MSEKDDGLGKFPGLTSEREVAPGVWDVGRPHPATSRPPLLQTLGTHTTGGPSYICPDLLRLQDLGGAVNWRGHVVRGFFWLLARITGV